MRVLVTGGAGFIGSHLCERLLREGCRVVCVDNLLTGRRENIEHLLGSPNFSFVRRDVREPFEVEGPLDFVLHLASPASPADFPRIPVDILMTGALGTYNALELAVRKGAVFLLASTSEVYGDPQMIPQPEVYWGHVNPIGPRSCYDEAKRFAEALTMAYRRKKGLPVRIARIFNTYGPRMRPDDGRVIPNFVTQALKGEPLTVYGDGLQTRSFCYVDDLVEGLWRLMNTEIDDALPVNLGNPREVPIIEVAKLVKELTGSDSPIVFKTLPKDDPKRRCPDIRRARELLGWEPKVPLEEGLRRTVEYFRKLLGLDR